MLVPGGADSGRLRALVLADLKRAGLKHRAKKTILKHVKDLKVVFGAPLHSVPLCAVTCCGSILSIPLVISEIYSVLRENAHVEGIFRKAGSQSRQKEIRRLLDSGGHINESHHPVDVASILKLYLRGLPEPVISPEVQELLLRCRVAAGDAALRPQPSEEVLRPLLHTLMLLPVLHVHLLHYVMELLNLIASKHKENLMDATNLAIVMTPSIMPLPTTSSAQRLDHHVALVKLFIENSKEIGNMSDELLSQLDEDSAELVNQAKKKKRRSGSLNRVLNGLRKMVGGSTADRNLQTPVRDRDKTPIISKSAVKRKLENHEGLSAKTKKEIKKNLPQKELTFTPKKIGTTERKKLRLSMTRTTPITADYLSNNYESSVCSEDLLTSTDNLFTTHDTIDLSPNNTQPEKDYVRIPKQEFEEIKSRVSAIESRLSKEFTENVPVQPLQHVQNVYEQTLEDMAMMNYSSSDHLARRLSRELKIRQSDQHKIIRSPSARKIGTIRRRSKENVTKLIRHKSWNVSTQSQAGASDANRFYPYVGLKRGRPNTLITGLPDIKNKSGQIAKAASSSDNSPDTADRRSYIARRQSARESTASAGNSQSANCSEDGPTRHKWKNAATYFMERTGGSDNIAQTGRPSVNKLRSQNAGTVLAKAKMFESSSDKSSEIISNSKLPHSGFARRPRISGPLISKPAKPLMPPVLKVKPNSAHIIETNQFEHKPQRSQSSPSPNKVSWDFSGNSKKLRKMMTSPVSSARRSPQTPMIKKSLSVKSPRSFRTPLCTTESRINTPMRATHTSPQRRSPRLKAQRMHQ